MLLFAFVYVVINLIVDVAYAWLDQESDTRDAMVEAALELKPNRSAPRARRGGAVCLRIAAANPLGVIGLIFISTFVFCAIFADFIMPYDPEKIAVGPASAGPSSSHPFGTDSLGTDTLSRTIFGARIALLIGVIAVTVGSVGGTVVGIISGYFGGFTDSVIQRVIVALLAFPAVVLLLVITSVVLEENSERPSPNAGLTLSQDLFPFHFITRFRSCRRTPCGIRTSLMSSLYPWPLDSTVSVGTARVVRGAVLSLKEHTSRRRGRWAPATRASWPAHPPECCRACCRSCDDIPADCDPG